MTGRVHCHLPGLVFQYQTRKKTMKNLPKSAKACQTAKVVRLFSSTDLAKSLEISVAHARVRVSRGQIPKPSFKIHNGAHGVSLWTEAELLDAGLPIPRTAAITIRV